MAELLLRWLNHELELSTHVTEVESDFASGYLLEKHKLFEHSIRRHVRSIALLQQEKDQITDEPKKRGVYLARMAEQREILEATKAERLHRAYIHSSFIKEALEETESPARRLALQKKSAREQRRTAFFQQLMKNREEAEKNLTFSPLLASSMTNRAFTLSVDNAIPPFRPYEIRPQLVFADAEWMYILHKFECPTTGRLYAEGLCRASCKQDDEKVSAAKLYDELPKDMPDVVVQLLKWDSSQRIKLEAPTEAAQRQDETTTR
ncbi:hypothetical protein PI124_g5297 [Phytophthora idaei]|nr:hypothetical protein PI125_g4745 [Phytophthora idaei]KAG3172936.1 hypothetical protein PI126_g1074 [Phytophthora idaei]KAG3250054.1 hypothetical protein PI124_g5297 [Phytophthora idaei]